MRQYSSEKKGWSGGNSQHVVGGINLDRLREKADCLVELAGSKGVIALFLEFFSHAKVFFFDWMDCPIFYENHLAARGTIRTSTKSAAPDTLEPHARNAPPAWRPAHALRVQACSWVPTTWQRRGGGRE